MANSNEAMREALIDALAILEEDQKIALCRKGFVQIKTKYCDLKDAIEKCRDALALPRRQCDVGTAEEQAKHLNEWCSGRHCINCQFKGGWPDECKLQWAQMPYEEKGENDGSK